MSDRADAVASYGQLFSGNSFGGKDPLFSQEDTDTSGDQYMPSHHAEPAAHESASAQQPHSQQQQQQYNGLQNGSTAAADGSGAAPAAASTSALNINVTDPVKKVGLC